jgi:protoheme IX farnesyltransferase
MNFRAYYTLTKPGIIYGNLFVAVGAFFLAGGAHNILILPVMFFGLGFIIASAGVLNNYFDRDIDIKMERTKERPSVTGEISSAAMVAYGISLGVTGTALLYFFTNLTAAMAALFGWFLYLVFYTLLSKRTSYWGTFIGGFSGAMPPVVGYTAFTGNLDVVAVVLFLMLFFWQMPHAYAITLFRLSDYRAAQIPVLPIAHGVQRTKIEILIYALLFVLTAPTLYLLENTGIWYLSATTFVSLYWLYVIKKSWKQADPAIFGKGVFLTSLIVLTMSFMMMGVNSLNY